jgi:catechol 2,3-dioxygenase-like lactoylglutathione lyase family enzyme
VTTPPGIGDRAGIGDRVRRISHVVVNVTDLDRSVAFYEAVSALRVVARYDVPEQPLAPLPIDADRGSHRGAVLDDQTGGDPVAVHLVEWRSPAPTGRAMPTVHHHRIVKLGNAYADATSKRAQLAAAGAALTNPVTVRNYLSILDPDGVIISVLQADGTPVERHFHTCLSVISVEETVAFYRDVIGLDHWMRATVPSPVPASQGPGSDVAQFDSNFFRGFGDRRFSLDCSKSLLADAPEPSTPPANQVGISRVAIEVADVDACHRALRLRCADRPFGPLGDVVTWRTGDPVGDRRVCYVTDPNGHLLELFEPCSRTFVVLHPSRETAASSSRRGSTPST